jgi:hypothetical protein
MTAEDRSAEVGMATMAVAMLAAPLLGVIAKLLIGQLYPPPNRTLNADRGARLHAVWHTGLKGHCRIVELGQVGLRFLLARVGGTRRR